MIFCHKTYQLIKEFQDKKVPWENSAHTKIAQHTRRVTKIDCIVPNLEFQLEAKSNVQCHFVR